MATKNNKELRVLLQRDSVERYLEFQSLHKRQTTISDQINEMYKKHKIFPGKKKTRAFLENEISLLDEFVNEFRENHYRIMENLSNYPEFTYNYDNLEEILVLKDIYQCELKKSIGDSNSTSPQPQMDEYEDGLTDLLVEIEPTGFLEQRNISRTAERHLEVFVAENCSTCRICSTKNTEGLVSLSETIDRFGKTVVELIYLCIGVQIYDEDMFPQNVCLICLDKLQESYLLKLTCFESNAKFQDEYRNILELEDPPAEFLADDFYLGQEDQEDDDADSEFQLMDASMLQEIRESKGHSNMKAGFGFESTCYICNGKFKSMEKVFLHYLRKHRTKGIFVCNHPKCNGKQMLSSKTFHFHLQAHYAPCKIKCKLCLKKFFDEWSFRKHNYKHNDFNNLLECEHCGVQIWFKSNLDKHIREEHLKIDPPKKKEKTESRPNRIATTCYICLEMFDSMEKVFVHLKNVHSKKGAFNCHISGCRGRKYLVARSFHFHLKSHYEPQTLKCPHCDRIFNDEWMFTKHKYSRHSEKFEMRRMEKEQLRLSQRQNRPPKEVKAPRRIPGNCYVCKMQFDSMEKLFGHIKAEHIKNGVFRCYQQQCYGKKFTGPRSFHYHLEAHFSQASYKCKLCDRIFKTEWSWKCHKYRHLKVNLVCDYCGKQLSAKHTLVQHIERIHKRNGRIVNKGYYLDKEKASVNSAIPKGTPSSCYVCNLQLDSRMKLYSHIQQNHAEQGVFHCIVEDCHKRFMSASSFHYHLEGHVNPKAFECTMCNRVFPERNSYLNHIYNHKFRIQLSCDICGAKIWYKRNMIKHMVKVHKMGKLDKRRIRKKKKIVKISKTAAAAERQRARDARYQAYESEPSRYDYEEVPEEYEMENGWDKAEPYMEEDSTEFTEGNEIYSIVQIKEEKKI